MWKHPERGLVKANFDAAKKGNGIGVIFRDCKGDPHVAEALAFQFSTKIASQLSITVASYETDCQFLHKLEKKKDTQSHSYFVEVLLNGDINPRIYYKVGLMVVK